MVHHYSSCQKVIFFILLTCFTHSVSGQILNVESARIKRDSTDFFIGSIGLSFSLYNRNAGKDKPNNFIGLAVDADLAYFSRLHSYQTINYLNYTSARGEAIIRTGYSHFRINLMRKQKLSYELFTQYQYDLGRGMEHRWLGGGGLRYQIIQSGKGDLTAGVGAMYEVEEWEHPGEEATGTITVRLLKSTNYISTRIKFNENVNLNSIAYFQTGYDNAISAFRHRLSGDLNVNVHLTKKLILKTSFACTYENRPIVPITKFIYSITNGIQVNF